MKKMTFIQAIKDYFGPTETCKTATDWLREIKALTPDDRKYFTSLLNANGYEIQAS